MDYHTTVLLNEGVDALELKPDGVYVDVTFGGGGHSRLILERLSDKGRLIGFDQDPDSLVNVPKDDRFEMCHGNFRFLTNFLLAKGVSKVDGVLADLGVSGFQFDEAERGFSFRFDAELDMRMNKSQEVSAKGILEDYDVDELKRMLKYNGEVAFAYPIAKAVVEARLEKGVRTTGDLVSLIEKVVPEKKRKSELAKVFQAVRIEVNDELGVLKGLLLQLPDVLNSNGRAVIISYHSLEDRLVKHFFRTGNLEDRLSKDVFGNIERPLDPVGKVIKPSRQEIDNNPRARSAKMRIAQMR